MYALHVQAPVRPCAECVFVCGCVCGCVCLCVIVLCVCVCVCVERVRLLPRQCLHEELLADVFLSQLVVLLPVHESPLD